MIKKTKLLMTLVIVAVSIFVISGVSFARYGAGNSENASGAKVKIKTKAMVHTGEKTNNASLTGVLHRAERSTQLKQNIGTRSNAVDGIMDQWKGENELKTKEKKLEKFREMHERVERIRDYVEEMDIIESDRALYRDTFEYLSLQLEDSLEEIEAE